MTITATVIADSISPQNIRLTTLQLRYPRFIHAEFMTHRVFSRNASSSRAVPVKKLIEDIERDPAMPLHWGKNQPGMQAREELDPETKITVRSRWLLGMSEAIRQAEWMHERGAHKQIVNRILEPFSHINVVVTATEWANFFALRRHPDAQPEIKALADAMWEAMNTQTPVELIPGEWHVPYYMQGIWAPYEELAGEMTDKYGFSLKEAQAISVARCARVSYLTHDGRQSTIEEDLALYERLVGSAPLHASPAEHQATPDTKHAWHDDPEENRSWANAHRHGNLRGWIQYRKTLPGEYVPG